MTKTKEILMERDGLTEKEADAVMTECREALYNGDFSAMHDILGLEDDAILDLI